MWLAATYSIHEWTGDSIGVVKIAVAGGLGGVAGLAVCVLGQLTLSHIGECVWVVLFGVFIYLGFFLPGVLFFALYLALYLASCLASYRRGALLILVSFVFGRWTRARRASTVDRQDENLPRRKG